MDAIGKIQLGKNGLTEGFYSALSNLFKTHRNVKVGVLRSSCRDKTELKEIEKKILDALGKKFTARSIGYVIAIKKHRKAIR